MLALDTVTCADFLPALQQEFRILPESVGGALVLTEAKVIGAGHPARREPFSLTFRGTPPLQLPQGIHRLSNLTLGEMELFLVQIGAQPDGSYFEAIFN